MAGNTKTGGAGLEDAAAIFDDAVRCLRRELGEKLDECVIDRLVVGVFVTGVMLSNGHGGVAYTPPELVARAGRRILRGETTAIRGMTAMVVAQGGEVGPFGPVIRLATLSALSVPLLAARCPRDAADATTYGPLVAGRDVCMVGAMVPLIHRLLDFGPRSLVVADRKHETLAEVRGCTVIGEEAIPGALAACQTAILTGAAIPNGSLPELLGHVSPETAVAVVGPTAGFVPEPLFDRGVVMVGTTIVTDAVRALDIVAEGGGMYPMFDCSMRKINLVNDGLWRRLGLPPLRV